MSEEFGKPDWAYESMFIAVPIAKAVWLSLDRNPTTLEDNIKKLKEEGHLRVYGNIPDHIEIFGPFMEPKALARFKLVASWFFSPTFIQITWKHEGLTPMSWVVDLRSFGTHAKTYGLDLPAGFPLAQNFSNPMNDQTSHKQGNSEFLQIQLPYLPKELQIVHEVIREVHKNHPKAQPKEIQEIFRDVCNRSNYSLSKSAIEQFSSLVYPDELAVKDPRSRKHPRNQQRHIKSEPI